MSTIVIVPSEVSLADDEIVIGVEFPELAVDDIEVFVGEILRDEVDILFRLEAGEDVEEVGASQLA